MLRFGQPRGARLVFCGADPPVRAGPPGPAGARSSPLAVILESRPRPRTGSPGRPASAAEKPVSPATVADEIVSPPYGDSRRHPCRSGLLFRSHRGNPVRDASRACVRGRFPQQPPVFARSEGTPGTPGRSLQTDFLRLHAQGAAHAGIAYCPQLSPEEKKRCTSGAALVVSMDLEGGQSWPQPPIRWPEPAESRLRARLPALQIHTDAPPSGSLTQCAGSRPTA